MKAPRIVVVALGNLMRTDDAVGMLAVERLRQNFRLPAEVLLVEGGTLGLDLLYSLQGATHLLALDAVDAGETPGSILRFAGEQIADLPTSKSVHLLGFSDVIGALRLTDEAPQEIVVLGVQPHTIAWGTQLTPPVERALPKLTQAALDQIQDWTCVLTKTPVLAESHWYW
jgi:hydrogenase maturation protease